MDASYRIAEKQYGAITRTQLREAGLSDRQIEYQLAVGRIENMHPNVFRVVGSVRSSRQRAAAALLWLGDDAHLSVVTAGALLRMDGLRTRDVFVTVPADSRRGRGQTKIHIHRSNIPPSDRRVVDRLRCTSAARTLVDLAATLDDESLEAAFESARRMGLATPTVVRRVVDSLGIRAGKRNIERVLAAAESRPKESRLEVKLARLLRSSSFPPSVPQFELLRYRLDRAWPERKLAVEADGFQHHGRLNAVVEAEGGAPAEREAQAAGRISSSLTSRAQRAWEAIEMQRYDGGVTDLDFLAFDADNHYYEALDAFTRHVPANMQQRCVQWCEINGRKYHVVGGIVSHAVTNPTFDPVAKAGAMHDYFRGNPNKLQPYEFLREREPIPAEYRDRDARVAKLDEFGLEAVWLFPTLGILYEELLKHDVEAVTTLFTAFNRWLEEDWGCNYQDRIFAAPYITLADLDWAIKELEWAIDHDARTVVMRPAVPHTRSGQIPVSDPRNDAFWARVNEAGITVVAHAGDSGHGSNGYAADGFAAGFSGNGRWAPSIKAFGIERAAYDFLITLVFDKLFERFPNVRVASVENGSEFLGDLFRKLRSTEKKMPGYFTEDPCESYKRNVWMNPFWEDDINEVVDLMGADRVIFGSDWPHIEGMPKPLDYAVEVKHFDDADQLRIMRDNARVLNTRTPL